MITMLPAALHSLRAQARAAYPEECCGALLGCNGGGDGRDPREIVRPVPLPNDWDAAGRDRRYLIGSDAVHRLELEAERDGLELIGFFHSHPDHPAVPSAFDREQAWPWYSYVIIPVIEGVPGTARTWRLADDRSGFAEDSLRILEHP
jgi:proteasome lid subunit RPN8/RPN11